MKFVLEPDNRNCPDSVLLEDIRRVAEAVGRKTLTKKYYDAKGRFHSSIFDRRFGSWNKALEKSGLQVGKRLDIPKHELVEDLNRVASKLGKASVSAREYRLHGQFSIDAVQRAFGSWKQGLHEAGLKLSPNYHERATEDQLLANLGRVWEQVGRQPRTSDLDGPYSSFPSARYRRRFGSFRKALEAFVASINEAQAQDAATTTALPTTTAGDPKLFRHKTPREVSWRLRFLVMRRDHFKCVITGRSPATDPTVVLEVDHIIPWDKGGETVMENLQTVCREMNIGKSNLDMYQDGLPAHSPT